MKTTPIYLPEYLNKIFTLLSNILSFFLDNLIGSYCTIFILVITLLGFVLFAHRASFSAAMHHLMDSPADVERRANENNIPLNLAYVTSNGSKTYIVDMNDSNGLRMRGLFLNQANSFVQVGDRCGIEIRRPHDKYNDQGQLLANAPLSSFMSVSGRRGVLTMGQPILTNVHGSRSFDTIVLRISRYA